MDVTWWVPLLGAAGAAGAGVGLVAGRRHGAAIGAASEGDAAFPHSPGVLGEAGWDGATATAVAEVLRVVPGSAVLIDAGDAVVLANPAARSLGLVRGHDLAHVELRDLARAARKDGSIRDAELELARGPLGSGTVIVAARVAPMAADRVLLLIEDRTQAQRVEAIRRDFVANVSHELKTPVGGIALLAEAVVDASDDPVAVRRFAGRIGVESARLTRLVQEIIDLSRLQSADSLSDPRPVSVAEVASEAVERIQTIAEAKGMHVVVAVDESAQVYGDAQMLHAAIENLLTNAVNYSEEGTRVAVSVRRLDAIVEITVSDQGCGIPAVDLDRIFERFYRVDRARSRATGGTGLGLAIVKHICTNHGGDITVWSEEGRGTTFTIRLPALVEADDDAGAGDPAAPRKEAAARGERTQSSAQGPQRSTEKTSPAGSAGEEVAR